MAGLDARIVVVGLDVIISSLKADLEQGLWFTQAYMLGSTVMLLLARALYYKIWCENYTIKRRNLQNVAEDKGNKKGKNI